MMAQQMPEQRMGNGLKLALAWGFVGVPLAWGIVETLINAIKAFY
jgi:hypothetical protein